VYGYLHSKGTNVTNQRRRLCLFFLAFLTLDATQALPQQRPQQLELAQNPPILYTGRLFGYFRWPDQQTASPLLKDACDLRNTPNDPTNSPNDNARDFLEALKAKAPYQQRILVGTGDNFAPELFSRTINDPNAATGDPRGLKDNYVWDSSHNWRRVRDVPLKDPVNATRTAGSGSIPMDNVACFVARAGYDALVPGKYDFYFGAERLREIARFLSRIPETSEFHRVGMLGTNLAIESTVDQAADRIPHWEKHTHYSNDADYLDLSISDGDQVLPWLREISIAGLKANNEPFLCRELSSGDPDAFEVPIAGHPRPSSCESLRASGRKDTDGRPVFAVPDDRAHPLADGRIATFLQPSTNYRVCITGVHPNTDTSTYCAPFTVLTPFFTHPEKILAPGQGGIAPYPLPYVIKEVVLGDNPNGPVRSVAIFGVVDPSLDQHIGAFNDGWVNAVDGRSTRLRVMDPVRALRELLQYFNEDQKDFHGLKVLLAHLPHYEATELSAKFRDEFQVVITEAELGRSTEEQTVEFQVPVASATNRVWAASPVIVVPKPVYDPAPPAGGYRLTLQMHQLIMEQKTMCNAPPPSVCKEKWGYADTADDATTLEKAVNVHLLEAGNDFDTALGTALAQQPFKPQTARLTPLEKLQYLTLSALRTRGVADVILLQKRDWLDTYVEHLPGPGNLQETLDRIFFKGDFLTKTVVTGKALKQVMDQSSVFNKEDKDNVSLFHEAGRGLKPLGILKDATTEDYYVNGEPVQDDQLYSVVASDYIASGDTGYTDMAGSAVGDPVHPSADLKVDFISSIVCEELAAHSTMYAHDRCRYQDALLSGADYFDTSNLRPTDTTNGVTATHHFLSWLNLRRRPSIYKDDPTGLETRIQNRPFSKFSLEKADFGFDYQDHNRNSEAEVARLFSGVSQQGIDDSKQSRQLSADWRIRATRGYLFGLSESEYESQYVRGSGPAVLKNSLAFEGGILPRIGKLFFPLLSLRGQTPLAAPIETFTVDGGALQHAIKRDKDLLGKFGARYENLKSWIEAGYQFGEKLSTPGGFIFNPDSAAPIVCRLGKVGKDANGNDLTVGGCIDENKSVIDVGSGFTLIPVNKFEHGLFLNFVMTVPLPFKNGLTYTMENHGNAFFNRPAGIDLPVDTRYYDTWAQSLAIPLPGNFSLVPKFEYLYFRNKVDNSSLSRWQQTINFQYNFDWRPGIPFWTAFRYRSSK